MGNRVVSAPLCSSVQLSRCEANQRTVPKVKRITESTSRRDVRWKTAKPRATSDYKSALSLSKAMQRVMYSRERENKELTLSSLMSLHCRCLSLSTPSIIPSRGTKTFLKKKNKPLKHWETPKGQQKLKMAQRHRSRLRLPFLPHQRSALDVAIGPRWSFFAFRHWQCGSKIDNYLKNRKRKRQKLLISFGHAYL